MSAANLQDTGVADASSRRASNPLAAAGMPFEKCLVEDLDEPRLIRQFEQLTRSVLRELPPETGGSLLLAGVGSNSHVADVAAHVARRLAIHGRASLLVDADASERVLTQRFAATGEKGLVETLLDGTPASHHVLATSVPRLAFLAFGQGRLARRTASPDLMRSALAQWHRDYLYIVIAGGVEVSASVSMLARQCDATYLVVQLGVADRQQTTSAALTLMAAGARLLGTVATGVPDAAAVLP